jgi:hypothetical protein
MQFRNQFLDGAAIVVRELTADAWSAASAFGLVVANDWPLEAVSVRVLDADGREVSSAIRGAASLA